MTSLYVSSLVVEAVAAAVAAEGDAKKAAATGSVANELVSHWRLVFDDCTDDSSDCDAVWRLQDETDDFVVDGVYAEVDESTKVTQKEARKSVENAMVDILRSIEICDKD